MGSDQQLSKIATIFKDSRLRFQIELEFVELLANPWYLQCMTSTARLATHVSVDDDVFGADLAQQRLFEDESFINYLKYLMYWTRPEYIQHIRYAPTYSAKWFHLCSTVRLHFSSCHSHPHSLYFLEMLQRQSFRSCLLDAAFIDMLHNNQYWHWRYFRANRYAENQQRKEAEKLQQQQ